MQGRGCRLGCIVAFLGIVLSGCLLPHLISSIYALVTSLTQTEVATKWLWGDWIRTLPIAQQSKAVYMVLAEGPICCAGIVALLIVILGAVAVITGSGHPVDEEADTYEDASDYENGDDYVE